MNGGKGKEQERPKGPPHAGPRPPSAKGPNPSPGGGPRGPRPGGPGGPHGGGPGRGPRPPFGEGPGRAGEGKAPEGPFAWVREVIEGNYRRLDHEARRLADRLGSEAARAQLRAIFGAVRRVSSLAGDERGRELAMLRPRIAQATARAEGMEALREALTEATRVVEEQPDARARHLLDLVEAVLCYTAEARPRGRGPGGEAQRPPREPREPREGKERGERREKRERPPREPKPAEAVAGAGTEAATEAVAGAGTEAATEAVAGTEASAEAVAGTQAGAEAAAGTEAGTAAETGAAAEPPAGSSEES